MKESIQILSKSRSVIQVVEVSTQTFAPYTSQHISFQSSRISPGVVLTLFNLYTGIKQY